MWKMTYKEFVFNIQKITKYYEILVEETKTIKRLVVQMNGYLIIFMSLVNKKKA